MFFISVIGGVITSSGEQKKIEQAAHEGGFPSIEEYEFAKKEKIETFDEWNNKKAEIAAAKQMERDKSVFYTPPTIQNDFIKLVNKYRTEYQETSNPIAKTSIRKERAKAVCDLLPEGNVKDWVGTIKNIRTGLTNDDASLIIELDNDLAVGTFIDRTAISPTNSLYYKLARLAIGEKVKFSGNFLKNNERQDCLYKKSLTEDGSMTEPEYVFNFDDLSIFYYNSEEKAKLDKEAEQQAKEVEAKKENVDESCMADIKCVYDKYAIDATIYCKKAISDRFKYRG